MMRATLPRFLRSWPTSTSSTSGVITRPAGEMIAEVACSLCDVGRGAANEYTSIVAGDVTNIPRDVVAQRHSENE